MPLVGVTDQDISVITQSQYSCYSITELQLQFRGVN